MKMLTSKNNTKAFKSLISSFFRAIAVIGLFYSLLYYSCSEKLDVLPQGVLSPSVVTSSEENIDALIIGIYGMLNGYNPSTGSAWQTAVTNWTYGDVTSPDAYKGSERTDQGPLLEIEKFAHLPSNSYFNAKWRALYEGIKRANTALEALGGSPVDKVAEVKFLRGHYYFDLKKIFDKLPYLDENNKNFNTKNFGGEELKWSHIEADFMAGVQNLPENQSQSGRPTKYAAYAYLGKTYLYQGKYMEAKAAFDQVVSSGKYSLLSEYEDIYDPSKKASNTESVFVVHHSVKDGANNDANGDYGSVLSYVQGGPGGCCGFFTPSQDIVNAHKTTGGLPLLADATGTPKHNDAPVVTSDFGLEASEAFTPYAGEVDPRLDYNIGRRGIPFKDWGVHPGKTWARSPADQGHYTQKKRFIRKDQRSTYAGSGGWGEQTTAIDYHIIRYADVLLMLAECEIELNNLIEVGV